MLYRCSGVVHFTPGAESHRGLCHGGAMTSVLDDVLGEIMIQLDQLQGQSHPTPKGGQVSLSGRC